MSQPSETDAKDPEECNVTMQVNQQENAHKALTLPDVLVVIFEELGPEDLVRCQRVSKAFTVVADSVLCSIHQTVWKQAVLQLRQNDDESPADWKQTFLDLKSRGSQFLPNLENSSRFATVRSFLQRTTLCWGCLLLTIGLLLVPSGVEAFSSISTCWPQVCYVTGASLSCAPEGPCSPQWIVSVWNGTQNDTATINDVMYTGYPLSPLTAAEAQTWLSSIPVGFSGGCFYCARDGLWTWETNTTGALTEICSGVVILVILVACCLTLWSVCRSRLRQTEVRMNP